MKALKISVLTLALVSSTAMANTVTDTAGTVVDGGKTLFNTFRNPAAVSLELGTQGYGANVAWGINKSTELQAGWAGMDLSVSADIGDDDSIINWDKVLGDDYQNFTGEAKFKVKTSNPYLGVQMRPMSNWITVGAGIIVPDHKISTSLTATAPAGTPDTIKVNGTTYELTNSATISINAENHNKLAPYATLGFRPNINNRFGLFAEVGAAYVGEYDVDVKTSTPIIDPATGKNLQEELQKEIDDNSVSWYPIAKAGMTYRF